MKRVEAIRQRISNLANPYPWVYMEKHTDADPDAHVRDSRDPEEDDGSEIVTDWCVNLKFIASAPADLTYLLDRLERAEKVITDANIALQFFADVMAFTPSSVPGAIEKGLGDAYNLARKTGGEIEQFLSEEA